ncbi:conjugal transfer protein TraH [Glaesserella parasuis]|nr:conjugal transfer protein TraH [Glaesserella parasuis]MDO9889333.1 conjugal transfer protein TraH [Glaesserella parasuis]MDO9906821.1 conjugal transfer protein TraH [Glaesserella parasuis]
MAKWIKKIMLSAALLVPSFVQADINSDLNDFFNKLGGGSNLSQSGVIKAQSLGYLVGGSFYARVPVRNIQLISLTLPEVNAGCGGIDAYLGAFSFINSDQLKAMGKQILSNAIGYAFELALETTCPQCRSVKDYLQALVNDVNNLNVSTCQAAQGIVGGLVPKSLARDYDLCQKLATQNNVFSDWAKARQGCGTENRTNDVLNGAKESQKEQVPRNKNLVWSSFNKINQVVSNDRQLKELMMTIVGTVVYDKKGNMTVLPSLGANDNLINALLYGGTTTGYVCDESTHCLKPKKSQFTVRENSGLVYKVNQVLTSLYDGMRTDGKLTEQQKQLALNTRIPIIAYVKDVALLNAGSGFTNNLAEYLSLDFAISYVEGLIDVVSLAGANSFTSEHESEVFKENLRTVREKLSQNLAKVQIQQDAYLSAVKQLETLRKQLSHDLTNKIGFGE